MGMREQGLEATLSEVIETAVEAHVRRLESELNGGQPWPDPGRLVGGRPRGATSRE